VSWRLFFVEFFFFVWLQAFFQASAQMPTRGIYSDVTLPYLILPRSSGLWADDSSLLNSFGKISPFVLPFFADISAARPKFLHQVNNQLVSYFLSLQNTVFKTLFVSVAGKDQFFAADQPNTWLKVHLHCSPFFCTPLSLTTESREVYPVT